MGDEHGGFGIGITPRSEAAHLVGMMNGQTPKPKPEPAPEFWTARESLAHIHAFARARYVGPWALLGSVIVRLIAAVPPNIVLPAVIGGRASLNPFVAVVDYSGGGKGAAEAAAEEAIELPEVPTYGPGSGEGLAHLFMSRSRGQEPEQHTKAVILSAAEVDTLAALKGRQASTLFPELRKAWMGEALGFAYVDPAKRLTVPRHSYRLCLLVGVQPANAGTILEDRTVGTPQRFIWLPGNDPDAPETVTPAPKPWHNPLWTASGDYDHHQELREMDLCATARDEIVTARLQRLRGEADEELDGHALLAQEKVAAALALLDGKFGQPNRYEITEEDWRLAGIVRAVSDLTRGRVVAELRRAEAGRNRARGEADAERTILVTDRVDEEAERRVGQAIMRKVGRETGWVVRSELRSAVAAKLRGYFDPVAAALIDTGQLEERTTSTGHQGTEYRRAARNPVTLEPCNPGNEKPETAKTKTPSQSQMPQYQSAEVSQDALESSRVTGLVTGLDDDDEPEIFVRSASAARPTSPAHLTLVSTPHLDEAREWLADFNRTRNHMSGQ